MKNRREKDWRSTISGKANLAARQVCRIIMWYDIGARFSFLSLLKEKKGAGKAKKWQHINSRTKKNNYCFFAFYLFYKNRFFFFLLFFRLKMFLVKSNLGFFDLLQFAKYKKFVLIRRLPFLPLIVKHPFFPLDM